MTGAEPHPSTVLAIVALVVCGTLAGVAGSAGAATGAGATAAVTPPPDSYVVEQGGECQPIEPLSTDGTVESFYDYRNHETHDNGTDRMYSSYGTTHLQEDDTSALFLHRGTDGVSLVAVHDRVDGDTPGGVASFEVVGTSTETEWVVQDDLYDGETNMVEWHAGDGWLGADWIWSDARTDGGAIRGGLDGPFAVTVHPAFNEDAALYEDESIHNPDFYGNGTIDDWEVLSGSADDPDRTELSLEEPVTIRTGTCDGPSVTYDRTDDGNGITASINDAAPDDRLALQPTSGTGDNVTFDSVVVSGVDGDGSVTFASRADELPAAPADVESLSGVAMSGNSVGNASATVEFTVDATALEERGLEPEDVALYEPDGDGWVQTETTLTDESAAEYRYSAEVDSLEGAMVAERRHEPTADDDGASSMPGFAIGAAVAAILLVAALAARGRDR